MRSLFASIALIVPLFVTTLPAHAGSLLDYVGQCVPFARAASGIQIYGDAWTWWDKADGRYRRGATPREGAVIVLAKSPRLPLGHVAVVSRVVDRRVLMVTHANWSRIDGRRGQPEQDVTLFDVSTGGDWSRVKVWFHDNEGLGSTTYPAHGFIYATPEIAAGKPAAPRGKPARELSSAQPDYVGALIDAYR